VSVFFLFFLDKNASKGQPKVVSGGAKENGSAQGRDMKGVVCVPPDDLSLIEVREGERERGREEEEERKRKRRRRRGRKRLRTRERGRVCRVVSGGCC
jgi:hypothetical protein